MSSSDANLTDQGFGLAAEFIDRVHSAVARWQVDRSDDDAFAQGEIDAALMALAGSFAGELVGLVAKRRGGHAFVVSAIADLSQSIVDCALLSLRDDAPVRAETRGLQ